MTLYLEIVEPDGHEVKAYTYADAVGYDLVGPFFVVKRVTEDLFLPVGKLSRVKVIHSNHVNH
jgi:hypothetical protein